MATILVAASSKAQPHCQHILQGHRLLAVGQVNEALQMINDERVDLILCTMAFDESRMLDLLSLVRSSPETRALPFVCFRCLHSKLESENPEVVKSAKSACAVLGAQAFLNIDDFSNDREIRAEIEKHLPKKKTGVLHKSGF